MAKCFLEIASNLISQDEYKNSFSARYNVDKLVWYKEYDNILDARAMEKKLKGGSRAKKIALIEEINPVK